MQIARAQRPVRKAGSFLEQERMPHTGETVWMLNSLAGKSTQGTVALVNNIDNQGLANTYVTVLTAQGERRGNIRTIFDHKPRRQTRTDEFGEFKVWV